MSTKRVHNEAFGNVPTVISYPPSHAVTLDRPICRPRPRQRHPSVLAAFMSRFYYDPYQRAEAYDDPAWVQKGDAMDVCDEKDNSVAERAPKRLKSLASAVVGGIVQGLLYGPSAAVSVYKSLWWPGYDQNAGHRKQRLRSKTIDVASLWRHPGIDLRMRCPLDQKQQTSRHALQNRAATDDAWGLISKDDYDVRFLSSNAVLAPVKPKRTFKSNTA